MKVKPILDNWEFKGIEAISSNENRKLAEHTIPGRVGNIFQDLGSRPTEIIITGSLHGDEIRDGFLEEVRNRYKAALPVSFVADITTATEIQYVVIKNLQFSEVANDPDSFKYKIILNESPPQPPPSDPLGALDDDLLDKAGDYMNTVNGAIDSLDSLGNIPDLKNPFPKLKSSLEDYKDTASGLSTAMSELNSIFGVTQE